MRFKQTDVGDALISDRGSFDRRPVLQQNDRRQDVRHREVCVAERLARSANGAAERYGLTVHALREALQISRSKLIQ